MKFSDLQIADLFELDNNLHQKLTEENNTNAYNLTQGCFVFVKDETEIIPKSKRLINPRYSK